MIVRNKTHVNARARTHTHITAPPQGHVERLALPTRGWPSVPSFEHEAAASQAARTPRTSGTEALAPPLAWMGCWAGINTGGATPDRTRGRGGWKGRRDTGGGGKEGE